MRAHQTTIRAPFPVAGSLYLFLRAYIELLCVEIRLNRRGFSLVYESVRNFPVRKGRLSSRTEAEICHAVDLACAFYFKEVRCLQRSAATTTLLRNAGLPAAMVIGVHPCPFRAHAWVEMEDRIVNDKPYTSEMYTVLDRC